MAMFTSYVSHYQAGYLRRNLQVLHANLRCHMRAIALDPDFKLQLGQQAAWTLIFEDHYPLVI